MTLTSIALKAQSAQLSFLEKVQSPTWVESVVLKNSKKIEVEFWEIQYEANVFKLTSKIIEDKKFVKPISCSSDELANQQGGTKNPGRVTE